MLPDITKNSHQSYKSQIYSQTIAPRESLIKPKKNKFRISYKNLSNQNNSNSKYSIRYYQESNERIEPHDNNTINMKRDKSIEYKSNLRLQIRQLDRKIRQCQKKLQISKKEQQQQSFKLIKKIKKPEGFYQQMPNQNTFDFLTNPKIKEQPQTQEVAPPINQTIQMIDPNFISNKLVFLNKYYQKKLQKKIQRRQNIHKSCQRKIPKIYITQKTNNLKKVGKPFSPEQHLFRIYSKEVTPQEIYPTIPNFGVVKDNITKHINAYLTDFRPFLEKKREFLENNKQTIKQSENNK